MKNQPVKTPKQLGAVMSGYHHMKQNLTQQAIASHAGMVQSTNLQIKSDPFGSAPTRILEALTALHPHHRGCGRA